MRACCCRRHRQRPARFKKDDRHISAPPLAALHATSTILLLQTNLPPPAKAMHAAEKNACQPETSHMQNLCLPVPPRCCHRRADHTTVTIVPPAYSAIAMVLCMSKPLSLYGTLAVLGGNQRGRRKGVKRKRLARSLPPTLSPIRPGASGRHASFDAVQRALRPRYKSLAQGTCEFRSDSLGSIVITLESAALLELKIGRVTELLLRVWVCALFPRLMPVLRVPLFHATSFRLVPA